MNRSGWSSTRHTNLFERFSKNFKDLKKLCIERRRRRRRRSCDHVECIINGQFERSEFVQYTCIIDKFIGANVYMDNCIKCIYMDNCIKCFFHIIEIIFTVAVV
eukprot:GHVL01013421.1.p1 GENE.GHVL01013421.1~~GHVL01013421.1.p1  ORF type:complete len:104 (+),score=9.96 GHVL01013421.1:745-1056(+)